MTRAVALLRGVNVGGSGRLPMARLRATAEAMGLDGVRTYIQSGNLVFDTARRDLDVLGTELEAGIAADSGLTTRVAVRSAAALAAAAAASPFLARGEDASALHLGLLLSPADPGRLDGLDAFAPDELALAGGELHLFVPTGMGRSRLVQASTMRRLGLDVTVRNWRTVTALLEMAAG